MDQRINKIASIMEHLTAEVRPVIAGLWAFLGSSKDVKVTVFVSIDGNPGNIMFTNEPGDPWKHQERIVEEIAHNKTERGKTMVEIKHFGDRPK